MRTLRACGSHGVPLLGSALVSYAAIPCLKRLTHSGINTNVIAHKGGAIEMETLLSALLFTIH